MFFKKDKQKLENEKEQCIRELIKFTDYFIDDTVRKLYEIQDIQQLGISEEEKNKHRNVIINVTVKELLGYSQKTKELSSTLDGNR